tara:strand:- start:545 stop:1633 length:1089 start_codon:yes stop_codon:yes gene_type:complete
MTANLLKLGMFVMPVHDPDKPLAQCFDEDLELAVACERLGFDDFWVGEHHSSIYENIAMPEIFLARVLGSTSRIRIGPAPVCLQYHHPAHVASRLAFLDHLSHGRLNVCFGPGAIPTDMEVFGVDPQEAGRRVVESINMILDMWTNDPPYSFDGDFWRIHLEDNLDPEMGLVGIHHPLQQPHPPIFTPCISRDSVGLRKAAARGFRPISHHMVGTDVLKNHWETYAAGCNDGGREANPADWCVSRNVYVASTTEEARSQARSNSLGRCIEYIIELTRRGDALDLWKRDPGQADEELTLDYFMDEVIIAGDPDEVTRQLRELRTEIGDFGTLVLVAHDFDDKEKWLNSLDLFANEVVPAFASG